MSELKPCPKSGLMPVRADSHEMFRYACNQACPLREHDGSIHFPNLYEDDCWTCTRLRQTEEEAAKEWNYLVYGYRSINSQT